MHTFLPNSRDPRRTERFSNRAVSALITVEEFPLAQELFSREASRIEAARGAKMQRDEYVPLFKRIQEWVNRNRFVARVIVYENPYATRQLTRDAFRGPYDER